MVTGYPFGSNNPRFNYSVRGGVKPWTNPDTQPDPMKAYFTQLADPRYRKAMQQQNLFSNLLNFGAQMKAAGAPSLDPGYAGRTSAGAWAGLGKGLMSGNQGYRNQMMNAMKLKSMMDTSGLTRQKTKLEIEALRQKNQALQGLSGLFPGDTRAKPPVTEADPVYAEEYVTGPKKPVAPSALPNVPTKIEKYLGFTPTKDQLATLKSNSNDLEKFNAAVDKIRVEKRSQLNTEVKEYQGSTKEIRKVINTSNMVDQFTTGNPVHQVAILYKFVTALDPNSAVKEGEVELSRSVMTMQQRLVNLWKTYDPTSTGAPVAAKAILDEMVGLIKGLGNEAKGRLAEKQSLTTRRLQAYGVDPSLVFNPIQMSSSPTNRPKVGSTPTEKKHNLPSPVVGGT